MLTGIVRPQASIDPGTGALAAAGEDVCFLPNIEHPHHRERVMRCLFFFFCQNTPVGLVGPAFLFTHPMKLYDLIRISIAITSIKAWQFFTDLTTCLGYAGVGSISGS